MAAQKKCILIIEDEREIRDALVDFLESEGFGIRTAENGKEGLDVLKEMDHPCVILLDLFMPIMSGLEFLKELKKEHADIVASIPVVVLTAANPASPEVRSAQKESTKLMRKPIDLEGFLRVIESYCHKGAA